MFVQACSLRVNIPRNWQYNTVHENHKKHHFVSNMTLLGLLLGHKAKNELW